MLVVIPTEDVCVPDRTGRHLHPHLTHLHLRLPRLPRLLQQLQLRLPLPRFRQRCHPRPRRQLELLTGCVMFHGRVRG